MKMNKIKKSLLIVLILISIMICSCKKDNDEVIPNNPNMSSGENTNNNTDDVIITPKKVINENHVDFKGETLTILCDEVEYTDPRNDNYTFSDKKQRIKELEYIESAYNCKIEYFIANYFSVFDTLFYALPDKYQDTDASSFREAHNRGIAPEQFIDFCSGVFKSFSASEYNSDLEYNQRYTNLYEEAVALYSKNIVLHYTPLSVYINPRLDSIQPDYYPYVNFDEIDGIENNKYYQKQDMELMLNYAEDYNKPYQYPADIKPVLPVMELSSSYLSTIQSMMKYEIEIFDPAFNGYPTLEKWLTASINSSNRIFQIRNYLLHGFNYKNLTDTIYYDQYPNFSNYIGYPYNAKRLDYYQALCANEGKILDSIDDDIYADILDQSLLDINNAVEDSTDYSKLDYSEIEKMYNDFLNAEMSNSDYAFLPYITDINENTIIPGTYYSYKIVNDCLRTTTFNDLELFDLMVDLAEGFEHSVDVEYEKYIKKCGSYSACIDYINQIRSLPIKIDKFELIKKYIIHNWGKVRLFEYKPIEFQTRFRLGDFGPIELNYLIEIIEKYANKELVYNEEDSYYYYIKIVIDHMLKKENE